ncbi:ATP-binding cassette domain-containing protein [filamentous cyanobacterium LEGE 11480]|uniref:ATP-binding cassette domain-containing protein n=1 Tax=Romeriopsis navalis LEGE 11480 TaxID=2777977 RepID=A0A928VMF0_9CYAN|nr:ATP-binding cassette domain-containing protein [Romeriopsis navalis]MBE9030383.1 ATP-binding cassette domain-containing protein [Romeriopsis navalis LEGE 11480]
MANVAIENVYKSYPKRPNSDDSGDTVVLRSLDLEVGAGEFLVLVGPSGCGKSTLLRMIAGLETITGGKIRIGDQIVNDLPPKARDIAMVFQSYALYPHLSVYDNLAFGLRRSTMEKSSSRLPDWAETFLVESSRKLPPVLRYKSAKEKAIGAQVRAVAASLQIEQLLDRLPKQLSGGQKQRVALGRAMARQPQVFLMDEPLSNLDAKLRAETRSQIVKLQRQLGTTTIYVTHDQTEAMTMGDRIVVLNEGKIQQIATPLDLYNHPKNRFVAEFIGSPPMNFIPVQVKAPLTITHPQFRVTLPPEFEELLSPLDGRLVLLGLRPEHFVVTVPAPKNLQVKVELVEALGNETLVFAEFGQERLQVRIPPEVVVRPGDELWLAIVPEKLHLFDPETGLNLQYQ